MTTWPATLIEKPAVPFHSAQSILQHLNSKPLQPRLGRIPPPPNCTLECEREQCDAQRKVNGVTRLTSLRGSPREICSWSSFCSSFRAPIDCWFLAKSESSLSPASVKYLEKCSQLRLLAGNSSWESAHTSRQSIRSLLFIYIESGGCHD